MVGQDACLSAGPLYCGKAPIGGEHALSLFDVPTDEESDTCQPRCACLSCNCVWVGVCGCVCVFLSECLGLWTVLGTASVRCLFVWGVHGGSRVGGCPICGAAHIQRLLHLAVCSSSLVSVRLEHVVLCACLLPPLSPLPSTFVRW